jgi:penicillin-insensitive murein DD-endopeptidase
MILWGSGEYCSNQMMRKRVPRAVFRAAMVLAVVLTTPALAGSGNNDRQKGLTTAKAVPAKELFGSVKEPAPLSARAIGFYSHGCLAGAEALPVNGPQWQVMRLSRNRNWAHPELIKLMERLASDAKEKDGWPGLLVGDLSQPRGGPMLTGHASHQIGLDADIWLNPMPPRMLTRQEREEMEPRSVVKNRKEIDRSVWTEAHARLIRRAASYPEVVRIFVNPPIKKALCDWGIAQTGSHAWLAKVRPYYNHTYHFHVRIRCPKGSGDCKNQPEPGPADGTGCGTELAYWYSERPWARLPKPGAPKPPVRELMMSALPNECRAILSIK